jgi:hypothetical protein
VPQRFDSVEIRQDAVQTLSSGALRIPAQFSRPGVFTYVRDGKSIREYRPPEEVLKAESVATAADMPATVGHPGLVSASTWRKDSVGHLSSPAASETGLLGHVIVSDPDAIAKVKSRALRDLSPGYLARLDETPGVTPAGEPYDCVQRDIRYNHVALLPPGGGRQGGTVSLRLDAAGDQILDSESRAPMKIKIHFDGKDHEVEAGSVEHLALQARIDATRDAALVAATAALKTANEELAKSKARLDALDAAAKTAARSALEVRARKLLGADAKFDGKSDREVMLAAVLKSDAKFVADGKSDEYVAVRFDIAVDAPNADKTRQDAAAAALAAAQGTPPAPSTNDPIKAAEQRRLDDAEAWKKPLSVTRA